MIVSFFAKNYSLLLFSSSGMLHLVESNGDDEIDDFFKLMIVFFLAKWRRVMEDIVLQ